MKLMTRKFGAAIAAITTLIGITTDGSAAKVTLDGSGYYELGEKIQYFGGGVKQGGRYGNFGADYYHRANISMQWMTNRSGSRSGNLSFELWAMPYFGATKGIVLMTRPAGPLNGGGFYHEGVWKGHAIFLDEYRFPELNLFEYARKRWQWRDALSFRRDNLL